MRKTIAIVAILATLASCNSAEVSKTTTDSVKIDSVKVDTVIKK